MAKYLNELTGRVINIKNIDVLPEENKKHLKNYNDKAVEPEVIKIRKNAKDKE